MRAAAAAAAALCICSPPHPCIPPPTPPAGAALAAGEDPCAAVELQDYNLGLHIGSVFILLGVSLAGAWLPVALHISSKSSTVTNCVKLGTYFGGWGRAERCGGAW